MRLGVVADTHGSSSALSWAVRAAGEVDAWAHLGDIISDARALAAITGKAVYSVRGNCDAPSAGEQEIIETLGGVRFFLCHGHKYSVQFDRYSLARRAEELGCRIALYGHTHISMVEADGGLLLINPGSPALPRGGREKSIAVIELENGDAYPRIITMKS